MLFIDTLRLILIFNEIRKGNEFFQRLQILKFPSFSEL